MRCIFELSCPVEFNWKDKNDEGGLEGGKVKVHILKRFSGVSCNPVTTGLRKYPGSSKYSRYQFIRNFISILSKILRILQGPLEVKISMFFFLMNFPNLRC